MKFFFCKAKKMRTSFRQRQHPFHIDLMGSSSYHGAWLRVKLVMDEAEYQRKYVNLRILKSVQEYLKAEANSSTAVYPFRIPDDFLYQTLKLQGPEGADKLVHHILRWGLPSGVRNYIMRCSVRRRAWKTSLRS
jgi:hypothetical protein